MSAALPVSGSGWYDHEFGGDGAKGEAPTGDAASPGVGGGGLGLPDVQWVWAGLQNVLVSFVRRIVTLEVVVHRMAGLGAN